MNAAIYAFLAVALFALICGTVAAIQRPAPPAYACAVRSLTVTCGSVR